MKLRILLVAIWSCSRINRNRDPLLLYASTRSLVEGALLLSLPVAQLPGIKKIVIIIQEKKQ